jgi:hypothetical protein
MGLTDAASQNEMAHIFQHMHAQGFETPQLFPRVQVESNRRASAQNGAGASAAWPAQSLLQFSLPSGYTTDMRSPPFLGVPFGATVPHDVIARMAAGRGSSVARSGQVIAAPNEGAASGLNG